MKAKRFAGLGRLLGYSRPYSKGFITAFLLLMVATAFEMASPWVMKIILDDYIVVGNNDIRTLAILGVALTSTYVGASIFQYIQGVLFQDNALEVIHDIRQKAFSHLLKLPMKYFDGEPTGRLVSRLTNDSEVIRQMFVGVIPAILRGGLKLVGIFTALALLDFKLMLLMLVIVPILLGSMRLYQTLSRPVVAGVRARLADINTNINESLQGMPIIQATNQEDHRRAQFAENNKEWSLLRRKVIGIDSLLLMPFGHFLQTMALAGIVAWFGWRAGFSVVEVGTIYAFINYLARFFEPFRQISMQLGNLQQSLIAAERVFELLDEPEESRQQTGNASISGGRMAFNNVSLSYDGKNQALDNVSFTVEPGQFTAIVGHSGSGKSSVINLLMRFYQHQQGDVLIDGQALNNISESALRDHLGLVFQEPYIFSGSLAENISLNHADINMNDVVSAARKVHADPFIQKLSDGYEHQPGAGGQALSTGERQLLSFARTVAQNPRILLLDEATANIDGETEQSIKDALITLRSGRTTIAVAHRLSTIQDADQILVMDKGRIVQRGTHHELLNQAGHYRDLYLSQQTKEQLHSAAEPFSNDIPSSSLVVA
ncbi:multidrug ABC transporter ATP-binding protein [Endozoicomonas montiporae]|uniref:Multidrug ABC transporter ATP-binding protein n=2 Tax=Endozoicomonas montiporae TaxID=1027273 RepID=A0A081MYW6_9GAMM|nr:ABC transporter ATP-binding protein [Endozoicomonas montiporae]AMO54855.1 multidrug ABC transporter ATP-binding protein [Endozoicomonas montiporae CL-33]KEQ11389.1 multidrug ABC transporter ATP-binding protein [Endozoicomonas montiporae]